MISSAQYGITFAKETFLLGILRNANLRKKVLRKFNVCDKNQKQSINEYLTESTVPRLMFSQLSMQDKMDFCKILAVLTDPAILESTADELCPQHRKKLHEILSEKKLPQERIEAAAVALRFGQKEEKKLMSLFDSCKGRDIPFKQIEFQKKAEEYRYRTLTWKESGSLEHATALYVGYAIKKRNGEKEDARRIREILELAWTIVPDIKELNHDDYTEISSLLVKPMRQGNRIEELRAYTQGIHSGSELLNEMNGHTDFPCQYILNFDGRDTAISQYAYVSTINVPSLLQLGFTNESIQPRIAKEPITKEDRNMALQIAWQSINPFFQLLNGEIDEWEEDDRDIEDIIDSFDYPELHEHFRSLYLNSLYHILVSRIYYRDMTDVLLALIYKDSKDDHNKVLQQVTQEKASLGRQLANSKESLEKSLEQVESLSHQLEVQRNSAQNERNKKYIIEDQQKYIKELESECEALREQLSDMKKQAEAKEKGCEPPKKVRIPDEEIHRLLTEKLETCRVVIVDGHENFCRQLTAAQPNIHTIPCDTKCISESDLAGYDYIMCKSQLYGSHGAFRRAIDYARTQKIPFFMMSCVTNIKQTEREIYDLITENKQKQSKEKKE